MNQHPTKRWLRLWRCFVRTSPVLLALLLLSGMIRAGVMTDWCASMTKMYQRDVLESRVIEVRPGRRDSPLRYLNISDEETKEVSNGAAEVAGKEWISIGAVVTGCPCEDGEKCTDQVWVETHKGQGAIGLLLSKVDGHWQIGYVQRWWLRYQKLLDEQRRAMSVDERAKVEQRSEQMLDGFPSCGLDKKDLAFARDMAERACSRKRG